ncbi:hypothetical protein VTO42DRAFT_8235 [Malbranchea cinnamomea]
MTTMTRPWRSLNTGIRSSSGLHRDLNVFDNLHSGGGIPDVVMDTQSRTSLSNLKNSSGSLLKKVLVLE